MTQNHFFGFAKRPLKFLPGKIEKPSEEQGVEVKKAIFRFLKTSS
jgi:hypothetical protein